MSRESRLAARPPGVTPEEWEEIVESVEEMQAEEARENSLRRMEE